MGLINETNAQYYAGQQAFPALSAAVNPTFNCTFNTDVISAFDSTGVQVTSASNYTIYVNNVAQDESWSYVSDSVNNIITLRSGNGISPNPPVDYTGSVYIKLKQPAINANLGSYEYISIKDIVNNFMTAYVGMDKLIPRVRRSDVIFHAKRGLQEFSYDTLKSINSQELTIPPSLSVAIPQDYVNYVQVSRIDNDGVKRIIYPVNNLTTSPTQLPIQDSKGVITQNSFGSNNEAQQSKTEERWISNNTNDITGYLDEENTNVYDWAWWKLAYGQRYGLEPQISQQNGWFQINERTGTFSFSSDLANQLIVLEYISDGLAYDIDSKVPKMAEDALYAHINYSILSTRSNVQEYIVQRYKRDRSAKLRNAKIRLSNLKLDEIIQVFRGKSKWIKV
jgi:hypothetical protein|tara:strand:+ start:439 stop:1620 length:1182 start_codon:yes stop_codon:yes gene_type:complete